MARFNEILVGRYNKALTKLFSIKGSSPAPQCSSEIAAIIELEQPPVENRFLLSWDRFGTAVTQAAVAGQLSTVKLRNPVGSNVIAIFEKICFSTGAIDTVDVQMGTTQTDGAIIVPVIANNNFDSRSGRPSSLIFSASGAAAPVSQQTVWRATVLASTNVEVINGKNQEITLNPGKTIQVVMSTANLSINVSWFWRERLLEESERQ